MSFINNFRVHVTRATYNTCATHQQQAPVRPRLSWMSLLWGPAGTKYGATAPTPSQIRVNITSGSAPAAIVTCEETITTVGTTQ